VHEKRSKPQAPPSHAQGRKRGHDGNPFSRGGPPPLVLGPRGQAQLQRLNTAMMKTLIYLSMSRWPCPFTVLSAHGVTHLW
jgi:hypothetical protein